jgi:hypothetical protein
MPAHLFGRVGRPEIMTTTRLGPWLLFLLLVTPAARADSSPPPDRDKEVCPVDQLSPHALMTVPVPAGAAGHFHGGAK